MPNSFYNHGTYPTPNSPGSSAALRAELEAITDGFDLLPTLAGNGYKVAMVNSTGTALVASSALQSLAVTGSTIDNTVIGGTTPAAGTFTSLTATSATVGGANVVTTTATQTLTNKTLTAPVISTISNTGTLTLPTSSDTLVGRATTDTLTNKTISGSSNTLSNIGNASLTNSSVTIGSTSVSLGGTVTTVAGLTLTSPVISTIFNSGTLTLPTSTDTLVGRATTDTLTNKTISGSSNTLSNIGNASLTNSSLTIGSTSVSLGGTATTLAGLTSVTSTSFVGALTGNADTVTNGVYTTGSYSNPSWITGLAGSKISGDISGNAANVTGTVAVANGGTGATNASGARTNLGLVIGTDVPSPTGTGASGTWGISITGNAANVTGTVAVANGGTGATTAAGARTNLLPSFTGNAGKVVAVNAGATDIEYITAAGTGTVTSIDVSGGTTGLTTSGGPVTTAGTVTLAGTLATTNGGTGLSSWTAGDLPYYASGTALSKLGIGSNGQILTSNGTAPQWTSISSVGVTTFSAGTTGFTPSTATSGAVTLAGTLATTNGGTGLTSFTANGVVYASSTSALTTGSALTFTGTRLGIGETSPVAALTVKSGNGDQASFNNAGERFTQLTLLNNGTSKGGLWVDNTNSLFELYGYSGMSLTFSANGSEQMRLTSTGLGIGTSSPAVKLDITGNDRLVRLNATSNNALIRYSQSGVAKFSEGLNDPSGWILYDDAASAYRLLVDYSGNLGVGSVSPGAKLDVAGNALLSGASGYKYLYFNISTENSTVRSAKIGKNYDSPFELGIWASTHSAGNATATVFYRDLTTESMRLDASGNLGIGTSSPSAKLQVSGGNIRLDNNQGLEWGGGNNFIYGNEASDFVAIATNGSESMRLDSSGNLGIGVTPSAWGASERALQIGNSLSLTRGSSSEAVLAYNAYVNSGGSYIYNITANSSRYEQLAGQHKWFTAPSGTAGNAISFTQAMTLDASGNLALGATSASARLDVVGGSIRVNEDSIGTKIITVRSDYAGLGPAINVTTSHPLLFLTANTERARITSGGDLLVGTTTANLTASGRGLIVANGSSSSILSLENAGTNALYLFANGDNADIWNSRNGFLRFATNNTERARITSGGDFGIGLTPSGSYKLEVNGTAAATDFNSTSDRNKKTNIATITAALDKVQALRGVTFDWIADGKASTGLIAQEVEQVMPQVVQGDEGNKTVSYGSLVGLLIEAVKEQQATITQLTNRIAALEGK